MDQLFVQSQEEIDPEKRAARIQGDAGDLHRRRRRSSSSTRRRIRWRSARIVHGFVQIPLGNNIFDSTPACRFRLASPRMLARERPRSRGDEPRRLAGGAAAADHPDLLLIGARGVRAGARMLPGDAVTPCSATARTDAAVAQHDARSLGSTSRFRMQFSPFLRAAVHGDFGNSLAYRIPVTRG